jgi:sugar phosphate isomerase/epimerase
MAKDLEGTLRAVKDDGYDGVEFAGLCGKTPEEMKALVEEIGLVPLSAHISLYELREDAEKLIDEYARVGCKHLVVPGLAVEDRPGEKGFNAVVEDLERFGRLMAEKGITLSYHNHDFEFVKMEDGRFGFDYLYENTSPESLKMQQDVCWVKVAGEEPVAYLEKYKNRCPLLHLKDFAGEKSANMYNLIGIDETKKEAPAAFEFRPVGSGVQDFPAIIASAEKCGVEWLIVEQDEPSMGKTAMECAKMSIDYLRAL